MGRQNPDGSFPGDTRSVWTEQDGDVQAGAVGTFDWDTVDPKAMRHLVAVAAKRGDSVSFAQNRASTEGSITILSGAYRPRWKCTDSLSAGELIKKLTARYE
jgi:hypothetical protein